MLLCSDASQRRVRASDARSAIASAFRFHSIRSPGGAAMPSMCAASTA